MLFSSCETEVISRMVGANDRSVEPRLLAACMVERGTPAGPALGRARAPKAPALSSALARAAAATSLQPRSYNLSVCPCDDTHLSEALGTKHHQRHHADEDRFWGAHAEKGCPHRLRCGGAAPPPGG